MIGDVPKGAPLRCRLGRHIGQENGGTMVYRCSRCGGSFWQPADYSATTRYADSLIASGRSEEALRVARDAVRGRNAIHLDAPSGEAQDRHNSPSTEPKEDQ